MVFKNYEYFLSIAEEKSISKAAERMYISQPSLSKYLKRLEDNVGEELFFRDSYPLTLTRAGEIYLDYVKELAKKEKQLLEDFSYIRNHETGLISIGITVWRSSVFMPLIFPVFHQRYPGIKVAIQEGSHQNLASLLENGKVDFSIFHLPNIYNDFTFEHLQYERILFCVNQHHPLLAKLSYGDSQEITNMSHEDFMLFANEAFILLKRGQNIRDITQNHLNKLGITPFVLLETSNIVTATNMVKAGMGVTFIPEAAFNLKESRSETRCFILDHPPLQWEVGVAYKPDMPPKKHARLFIDCMKEVLPSE